VLDGGAYWRQLANTIEQSMCGGDTAFLANYFDDLFGQKNIGFTCTRVFDFGASMTISKVGNDNSWKLYCARPVDHVRFETTHADERRREKFQVYLCSCVEKLGEF